jgi:hypothetical protein
VGSEGLLTAEREFRDMAIEFYSVKHRKKIGVPEANVKKTTFTRTTKAGKTQVRYALTAQYEGTKLTKFVSKPDWDALSLPEV